MNADSFRAGSWWHQAARDAEQLREKSSEEEPTMTDADRTCVCGRTFPKPFGMRVHQRTCPAVAR
jgi:hypothetical protein